MTQSIGVIGQGFVGGTLTTVFNERGTDVYPFDKAGTYAMGARQVGARQQASLAELREPAGWPTSVAELVQLCESVDGFSGVYFVCVPTPMYEDGAADLRIVESVLTELAEAPGDRIAVVKSTVPPGSTDSWNAKFNSMGLHVVFNPEFLTEANALRDMRNQSRIVLGGPTAQVNKVYHVYDTAFPDVPILVTDEAATAEMVKYVTNLHLAVRVILSCEFYQLCEALKGAGTAIDYNKVVEYSKYDPRLGGSHMNVPGNEGLMGARGHCFPKDMNALIAVAKELGVDMMTLKAAWAKNLEVTPVENRDWEKMAGRAVSKRA